MFERFVPVFFSPNQKEEKKEKGVKKEEKDLLLKLKNEILCKF